MSALLRRLLAIPMAEEDGDGGSNGGGAGAGDDLDAGAAADGRPDDITQEEWDSLTDEERAAIADTDTTGDDAETLRRIAGDDTVDGGGGNDTQAGAADADDADVDASTEFTTTYRAELPADHQAQVDAAKGELKTLRDQFRAGELELDDYEERREAIDARLRDLDTARIKAEVSREMGEQTAVQRWDWEVQNFMAEEANAIYKGRAAAAAFDAMVKDLVSDEALKANPERANWSGRKILLEADKAFRAELGIGGAAADGGKPGAGAKTAAQIAKEKERAAIAARRPGDKAFPKTLAGAPAADAEGASGGKDSEFAYLDNLQGIAYENAIARMSDAQRERFMQAA